MKWKEIQILSAELLSVCVAKHKNSYLLFHEESIFRVQHYSPSPENASSESNQIYLLYLEL